MTKEDKEPMSMAIEVASTRIKARGGTQRVGKVLHSNGHCGFMRIKDTDEGMKCRGRVGYHFDDKKDTNR